VAVKSSFWKTIIVKKMRVEEYMTSNEISVHYQTTKLNPHHGWIIDLLAVSIEFCSFDGALE